MNIFITKNVYQKPHECKHSGALIYVYTQRTAYLFGGVPGQEGPETDTLSKTLNPVHQ